MGTSESLFWDEYRVNAPVELLFVIFNTIINMIQIVYRVEAGKPHQMSYYEHDLRFSAPMLKAWVPFLFAWSGW